MTITLAPGMALALFPSGRAGTTELAHGDPLLSGEPANDRPYLAINMVQTVDGRVVVAGSAAGLGSATDQRLMRRLRAEADALLYGANTVRVDPVVPRVPASLHAARLQRGQTPDPHGVVVSTSGLLPAENRFFTSATPEWRRYVYAITTPEIPQRPGVITRTLAPGPEGVRRMLGQLRGEGVLRMVCEGGPTLIAALLAADVVDELFVTVAPRLEGGTGDPHLVNGPPCHHRLQLLSVYERDGELFLRYRVLVNNEHSTTVETGGMVSLARARGSML